MVPLETFALFVLSVISLFCHNWRQQQQCMQPCQKASSTQSASHPVPHGSTERALRRLTSEFGRDPVYSSRYGRWQVPRHAPIIYNLRLSGPTRQIRQNMRREETFSNVIIDLLRVRHKGGTFPPYLLTYLLTFWPERQVDPEGPRKNPKLALRHPFHGNL